MKKILVNAYACEPYLGSEQGVGWNWVKELSGQFELHVITRRNNRENIENYISSFSEVYVKFYYYDTPPFFRVFKRGAKGLYLYYLFWQIGAFYRAKSLLKDLEIDFVWQLTMGSIWMPTYMHLLKLPFVWGPIGGGDIEPHSLFSVLNTREKISFLARRLLNSSLSWNWVIRSRLKNAHHIMCRTRGTLDVIPLEYQSKCSVLLETAITDHFVNSDFLARERSKERIKLIYSGRLTSSKNISSLVKALDYVKYIDNIEVSIVGSGSELKRLRRLGSRHVLNGTLNFTKQVSRETLFELLSESDVYVFPSLREGGSWSLMEAMLSGLPVICFNRCGMEVITDEKCALYINDESVQEQIRSIANNIDAYVIDCNLRRVMGSNARKRILETFSWESKLNHFKNVVSEI